MFNYRRDKIGFFSTLVLAAVALGTLVSTGVLLLVGGWETVGPWVKFSLGLGWVLCIGTVLVRVYTYQYLRKKQQQQHSAPGQDAPPNQQPDLTPTKPIGE